MERIMTKDDEQKEIELITDRLIRKMSDAIDSAIDAKSVEFDSDDLDENDEDYEAGLDDDEFEEFKEDLAESISMDAIVSSDEFGTVELVKAALLFFEKENRTDEWHYEVLENALEKAIKWDEENA